MEVNYIINSPTLTRYYVNEERKEYGIITNIKNANKIKTIIQQFRLNHKNMIEDLKKDWNIKEYSTLIIELD